MTLFVITVALDGDSVWVLFLENPNHPLKSIMKPQALTQHSLGA